METIFFWTAWGIISFWALKTFYCAFSKEKLERLRKAALGINLSVLVLSFLPWVPPSLGEKSGFVFLLEGEILILLFIVLLAASIVLFLIKDALFLKLAACATIINTFVLFVIMYTIRPGTFQLTLYDIAPILAVLLLLINDVAVLLLWQQLQLKEKKSKIKNQKSRIILIKASRASHLSSGKAIIVCIAVLAVVGWFVFQKAQPNGQKGVELVSKLSEVQEFKKAVEQNGRSTFAVDIAAKPTGDDEPYYLIQVLEIFPDHRTTLGWYRYDPKSGKIYRQDIATDTWKEIGY